jgi:hypothetical protein
VDPWIGLGMVGGLGALVAAHALWLRPLCMRWGSTDAEAHGPWPGDDLVPAPKTHGTHVITIHARAEEIWPWLVQIGQDRAGFYSYDWLERLFGFHMRNVDRVNKEWQRLQPGDPLRLHPAATPLEVVTVEANRCLVTAGGRELQRGVDLRDPSVMMTHRYAAYSWAFILVPQGDGTTRFIARLRATWPRSVFDSLRNWLFMEGAHLIMQLEMNRGLKRRAELPPT